jgi:hypothetical protein
MKPLTADQLSHIPHLLDSGASAHEISASTTVHCSTISRIRSKYCPNLAKPTGGLFFLIINLYCSAQMQSTILSTGHLHSNYFYHYCNYHTL